MRNFIEKTLNDIQEINYELFYAEETAQKRGIVQLLDPRVKLISFLLIIIIANFSRTIAELTIFISYILLLAFFSQLKMYRYLMQIMMVSFLFTGIILLPSVFNFVRQGEPLWYITKDIYITKAGFWGAVLMMMRSFVSLSLIYLMMATTKWVNVLKSLRKLKIPAVFIATIEMTHRYIFLGLDYATNLFVARKSRTLRKSKGYEGRRFVAAAMGNLLIRTSVLSDEVYSAMISRGYTGEIKTFNQFQVTKADYVWIGFNLGLILLIKLAFKF